ncbi:MAG: deoxyribonuclease IV [Planctomycetota bacterium]
MLIGSHLSIAKGLDAACRNAGNYGFNCLGLFVRNQVQWKAPPLADGRVEGFRKARKASGIRTAVAHASYLVNLAGADGVRRKSIDAMVEDLGRCGRLGVEYLVMHPGSNPDAGAGIEQIARGIDEIFAKLENRRVKLLLETTAGQGNCLGWRFEQLAAIRAATKRARRVGICLDTAHVFAAGYDIRTAAGWDQTLAELAETVGLEHLLAIHLNDSKREFACRVDRHEHLGRGQIGEEGLAAVVNDPRLQNVPFILETPKETAEDGRDWDEVNLETIRRWRGLDEASS